MQGRLSGIDALRGIAALGVAWFHLFTQNGRELSSASVSHSFAVVSVWGRWGIDLFFVISGFVVAYTMFERRDVSRISDVWRYFVRRSVRLDPTYWTCLCLAVLLTPAIIRLSSNQVFELFPAFGSSPTQALKNVLYFLPIGGPLHLPVAWTLALEVHFYVLFALILVLANGAEIRWAIPRESIITVAVIMMLLIWVLSRIGVLPTSDYWLTFHLGAFAIGISAAMVYKSVAHSIALLTLSLTLTIALYISTRESDLAAIFIAGFLVIMGLTSTISAVSCWRPFVYLGQISYCVYLLHTVIGGLTIELLQTGLSQRPGLHQIAFVVIGVFTTVLVSAVIYLVVERPSIRLSKYVRVGLRPKLPTQSTILPSKRCQ
jgi:peptidoglycan/LPS O-acetylase OafA/YrhL